MTAVLNLQRLAPAPTEMVLALSISSCETGSCHQN
jgi:hypothetical protein